LRALVVGYGSIGSRHARLLMELGCLTAVISKRNVDFPVVFSDVVEALNVHRPEYLVLANPTCEHYDMLAILSRAGYRGRVLIEKPLFNFLQPVPDNNFGGIAVAYNLRFHPLLQRLKALLVGEKILSVQVYVGQYLPDWRPGTDYRKSYSARADEGGGALRDLSHELDYLGWLCGPWSAVTALGGQFSELEIDSDDLFILLMRNELCPAVSVQLSYLDRVVRRRVTINTDHLALEADFVTGALTVNGKSEFFGIDRDYTYREMHQAVLSGRNDVICTLDEGLMTMQLIEAAEQASRQLEWVKR
jgi:predicted dehydrogenase